MVISLKKHFASEKRSLEHCIQAYPQKEKSARRLIGQINQILNLGSNSKILEIGAAQGSFVIACNRLGYSCEGLEPYEDAIKVSKELSKKLHTNINIKSGFAEDIPYDNNSFNIVIADSVIEHVKDVEKVFNEAFRVLKAKGAFYFATASSLCPKQDEIRFFPFFSWYPEKIKIKIMDWAKRHKPSLVGYTETPAINWFTPWKTGRLLKKAGFEKLYDRWDLLRADELSFHNRVFLKMIKLNRLTKLFADILTPGCAYLAVKGN